MTTRQALKRATAAQDDIDAILRRGAIRPIPPRPGLIREYLADMIGCAALFGMLIVFLSVTP